MSRKIFFDEVRTSLFNGKLNSKQVSGTEFILDQWNETGFSDFRWLAYALATTYHETAFTMQPIREYGSREYFMRMYDKTGSRPRVAKRLGNTQKGDGATYCGRGFVQLTGRTNYGRASRAMGIDFVRHPSWVMKPVNAAFIMFQGMNDGWFTGKGFSDYINDAGCDYEEARRIINGIDNARKISGYAVKFEKAINAQMAAPDAPLPTPAPEPAENWLTRLIGAIIELIFGRFRK